MKETQIQNIDQYIATFPEATQVLLVQLRAAIRQVAPDAKETMKYGMPTFEQEGNLVHFAAYAKHIGFYPAPSGILAFAEQLSAFKSSKGAVQFPIAKELPLDLVRQITAFRLKENLEKSAEKKGKKRPLLG